MILQAFLCQRILGPVKFGLYSLFILLHDIQLSLDHAEAGSLTESRLSSRSRNTHLFCTLENGYPTLHILFTLAVAYVFWVARVY